MMAAAAAFACWMLSAEPAAWATSCCAWSITLSLNRSWSAFQGSQAMRLTCQVFVRWWSTLACMTSGGGSRTVAFIKDLCAAQVHADQRIAADQPGTAATLALTNQHVGDRSAGGDQMEKAFEPLDCGSLALYGDWRGKGLETRQKERYADQGGCQGDEENNGGSHDG